MNALIYGDLEVPIGTRRYPQTGTHVEVWDGTFWSRKMNNEQPKWTNEQLKVIYQSVRRWQMKQPTDGSSYRECAVILDALVPFVYTAKQEQPT
jgi:hypothetical protein